MDAQICQQCKEVTNATDHRIVRDSCGHYKCRSCLVQEIDGCRACLGASAGGGGGEVLEVVDSKQKQVISVTELQAELLGGKRPPGEAQALYRGKKKRDTSVMPKNIIVEMDESGPWYCCTVCDKRSRARSHITYHAYCDGQIKPHTCTICQKGFATRSHYEYHMRVHEGRRPFICDACGLGFYQKSKLKRHVLKHTGEKRFRCAECGAAFNNAASLRKHGFIHSGLKPHKCGTCHRQFRDSSNLRKHESKHQTDVKHTCAECGKQYGVRWSLMLHAKSHREARPYRCPQCPQAFYSKKDMRRHAAVHSDNKPYRCTLCGTRFRRKDNLDRHLRNTHPGVDASKSFEIVNELAQGLTTVTPVVVKIEYDPANSKTLDERDIGFERDDSTNPMEIYNTNDHTLLPSEIVAQNANDYTEQNILEANTTRQTVIFGPIKPNPSEDCHPSNAQTTLPEPATGADEGIDKYKHYKKKLTKMEIYRNILIPELSQGSETVKKDQERLAPEAKPIPEYIHKKVNYELKNVLKKRGEQLYCSQVAPITIDNIDRIVRESGYYAKKEEDYRDPPEEMKVLYQKILFPELSVSNGTASNGAGDGAGRSEEPPASQPSPDMHWRRRMAMNTNR